MLKTFEFQQTLIHAFLSESYWAKNIPKDAVERSINHSMNFGAFIDQKQIGFARVITDRATFAYLADVFVVPEFRGQGVSKVLVSSVTSHKDLQGLRRMLLATLDAHSLYEQFGFKRLSNPQIFMEVWNPEVYEDE